MAKQANRPILPGVKAGKPKERDLPRLRELLEKEPLSFTDARPGYVLPLSDTGACSRVGWQAWKEEPSAYASFKEAIALVHQVYWEMYDER